MLHVIILPITLKGNAHVHTPLSKGDSVLLSSQPINDTALNQEHLLSSLLLAEQEPFLFEISREKNEVYPKAFNKGCLSYYEFDKIRSVAVHQEGTGRAQQHGLALCAPGTGHQAARSQQTCTRCAAAAVRQIWEQPARLTPQREGLFCFFLTMELHADL